MLIKLIQVRRILFAGGSMVTSRNNGVVWPLRVHGASRRNLIQSGFTVIELIVAITIVCLLVAVAFASYQDHMTRKARAQARAALVEVAEGLRMQYTRLGTYETKALPITRTPGDGEVLYNLSLSKAPIAATDPKTVFPASSAQGFTLRAVPVGGDACGTLLLDHTGRVGVVGDGAKLADCWPR